MAKLEKEIVRLRTLLSLGDDGPTYLIFQEGIFGELVDILNLDRFNPYPGLQNEILWILINVFTQCTPQQLEVVKMTRLEYYISELMKKKSDIIIFGENVRLAYS